MKMKYKQFVDEKVGLMSKAELIIDIGGGSPFQKWLQEYRPLFAGTTYKTMDYDADTNPDIVGDIHNLPFKDTSIDAIICAHVLEHVRDPIRAVAEMYRVLKPKGMLFLYVPSIHPYHARLGAYPDHWRFFEDTLVELLKDFSSTEIQQKGGYFTALSTFIPFRRHILKPLEFVAAVCDKIFESRKSPTTEGYFTFSVK
jgi:SAM-dependent methyltransferase